MTNKTDFRSQVDQTRIGSTFILCLFRWPLTAINKIGRTSYDEDNNRPEITHTDIGHYTLPSCLTTNNINLFSENHQISIKHRRSNIKHQNVPNKRIQLVNFLQYKTNVVQKRLFHKFIVDFVFFDIKVHSLLASLGRCTYVCSKPF